jgi:hypothetical protein
VSRFTRNKLVGAKINLHKEEPQRLQRQIAIVE